MFLILIFYLSFFWQSYSHKRARFNSNVLPKNANNYNNLPNNNNYNNDNFSNNDNSYNSNNNTDDSTCPNTFTLSVSNLISKLNNSLNYSNSTYANANFNNYLQNTPPPSSTSSSSSSSLNSTNIGLIKKQIQHIVYKPCNLSHGVVSCFCLCFRSSCCCHLASCHSVVVVVIVVPAVSVVVLLVLFFANVAVVYNFTFLTFIVKVVQSLKKPFLSS